MVATRDMVCGGCVVVGCTQCLCMYWLGRVCVGLTKFVLSPVGLMGVGGESSGELMGGAHGQHVR